METTAAKKKNKKLMLRTIRDDDMLRTHYPKRCPTYLVAFSLKETYDDLDTAQQMICKHYPEQSSQESTNSVTPIESFKILETETDKTNIIAKNNPDSPEHSPQESTSSITATGSFIKPESELKKPNKTAKNKPESLENSPQESTYSITPTGSFKTLETELEESKDMAQNKPKSPELKKSNTVAEINNDSEMRKESPDSITPKYSLKVLETKPTYEDCLISDKNHSENKPVSIESDNSSMYSTNSSTPTNSLMFSGSDYSTASRITVGEKQKVTIDFTAFETNIEEPSIIECSGTPENAIKCKEQKKVRQSMDKIEKYITVYVYDESDNKSDRDNTGDTVNTRDSDNTGDTYIKSNDEQVSLVSVKINENTSQKNRNNIKEPESIFKAVRKNSARKKNRSFRRKYNNAVNIKRKKFKCKLTKKKIDVGLEKYYKKRNNSIDAEQIQSDLYSDEVSIVVSRTNVVHKKARENLLKNSDLNMIASDLDDQQSMTSSTSTARGTLMQVSDSSQNILVQEASTISNVTDIFDDTVNQDIEVDHVSSLLKMSNVNDKYKSKLVSIPVTVAYDRSTVSASRKENYLLTSQETSEEIYTLVNLPLTSCEGVLPLVSNADTKIIDPISDIFDNVTIEPSDNTLINTNSSLAQLSHDDFCNARSSSQFSKCIDSVSTLTNAENTIIDVESTTEDSVLEKEAMIFDTVINLGRCDETPSTSSNTPISYDLPYFNDIIVANVPNDNKNHSYDEEKESIRQTILSKTTEQRTEKVSNKMLNLPNQMQIKAMLREREMLQLKCGDEMRNPPNVPPLWERLMSALEKAVHRLEENLVEKIMRELQKPTIHPEPNSKTPELTNKSEQAASTADYGNLSVQCELMKSTTIDKIMKILSSEGPEIKDPSTLHKVGLYNDIEVIISPTRTLTEKGDQNTVATLTSDSMKLHHHLSWLAWVPVNFIRENMLIITSVPAFFVFLLCIYSLIQFVMKPW